MKNKKWLIIGIILISVLFILKNNMLNVFIVLWIFGTLFMPYIIGIIISIIVIFLVRKNLIGKSKEVRTTTYAIIIIVCLIVCRTIGYPVMQYFSEKPDKVYTEMKKLSDSEKLIGLSKEEIVTLLGKPIEIRDKLYIYDAGTLTNYLFFGERESYDLFIRFDENDRVTSTKIDFTLGG